VDHLLISFCNPRPKGLALGRYCFDTGDFAWVETEDAFLGATGLCAFPDGYYVLGQRGKLAEGRMSLAVFDKGLRLAACAPLERVLDGHSMVLDGDSLLVTSSGSDEVVRVRWDGAAVSEETVWSASPAGVDTVHVNSISMIDGRPHISCFGGKGDLGWSGVCNGQVIDIGTGESICEGLLQPHTLFAWEGRPYVLDSRRSSVLEIDVAGRRTRERWHASGYLRGAATAGNFLYVAASAYRQKSKSTGALRPAPPSVETRCLLHRIDIVTGAVRTRDLTPFGLEIYDLACAPEIAFPGGREDAMALRLRAYDAATAQYAQDLPRAAAQEFEESLHLRLLYDAELHRIINEDHNFLAAAFALERLLARDPSNADWQYHYGYCFLYLNAPERAILHLEKALALGYQEFWVRYNLAAAHLKTGAIDAAREEFGRAQALRPEGVDMSALGEAIESVSQAHV
jgi:hypothetical protein